jgi:hypothetical protein
MLNVRIPKVKNIETNFKNYLESEGEGEGEVGVLCLFVAKIIMII